MSYCVVKRNVEMNCAVIDLGSNTIRLSVFHYEDSKITTVIHQKAVAGLAGYIKKNQLEQMGIQKACDVLCEFKKSAAGFHRSFAFH